MNLREQVPLAPYTTIELGGPARYFAECRTADDVRAALRFARERGVPAYVLGGGSNVIFADEGFDGLVAHVTPGGVTFRDEGDATLVTAGAGIVWDDLVARVVARGLSGIECLSGIPGLVGGTPIQNVGAYGQEIRETLVAVTGLDRRDLSTVTFDNDACGFAYRSSRFKTSDRGRYVVLDVTLRLWRDRVPELRYAELVAAVDTRGGLDPADPAGAVRRVRDTVLALRRRKSMVIDPADPNRRSVGSFFLNPVLAPAAFGALERRWRAGGDGSPIPTFPALGGVKVPAAWLVERAGFSKGMRRDGVGISTNHALALVNLGGGTARGLLALAAEIEAAVFERFGVRLEREPEVVGTSGAV